MEKERTVTTNEADAAIEAEIANLRADEYVRLAKRYEYARTRRKQYLYQLRYYQKKGRELADGTQIDELREQFPGQDRAKAFARFAAMQKQYPGIASVKDIARRSWERK